MTFQSPAAITGTYFPSNLLPCLPSFEQDETLSKLRANVFEKQGRVKILRKFFPSALNINRRH